MTASVIVAHARPTVSDKLRVVVGAAPGFSTSRRVPDGAPWC
jgi:hypothetical protein